MVVLEFFKSRFNQAKLPNLYYYRDKSQVEVDLIEERGMQLCAYEITSAKDFNRSFTKNLDYVRKVVGDDVVSTQVIIDGERDIITPENGTLNIWNIPF